MLETGVPVSVTRDISRAIVSFGKGSWAPYVPGFVVAQVERLAPPIPDGVIRPRRQLILAAVDRPAIAAAFSRHLEAEGRIRNDVDPRRRRGLAWADHGHVFFSALREAPKPVEELEI